MVSKNSFFMQSDINDMSVNIIKEEEDFILSTISEHIMKQEETFPYTDFVMYRIDLTSSIKKWSIWKRYNDFKELRDSISKNNYLLNLPDFPEKKMFSSKSKETIKQRKRQLSYFLNYILRKLKIRHFKEVIEFIEIDKETLNLLSKKSFLMSNYSSTYVNKSILQNSINKANSVDLTSIPNNVTNYYCQYLEYRLSDSSTKTAFMYLIEEFLKNLSENFENKTNIIKAFESFLKSKKVWPQFKSDEIHKLLFGELDLQTNTVKIRGLLFHIGAIDDNKLGAEESLHFLVKILDCEFNPEYEKYISILKQMRRENLESMNLCRHLEFNKLKTKESVFKLVSILYEKNNAKLDQILDDCNLLIPYLKYLENSEILN